MNDPKPAPSSNQTRRVLDKRIILFGLVLPCLLCACSAQWVRLDGGKVGESELLDARNACRIEEKRIRLEQAEADRTARFAQSKSNADKMLAREDFDVTVQRINAEIEACMRSQGLKRGS